MVSVVKSSLAVRDASVRLADERFAPAPNPDLWGEKLVTVGPRRGQTERDATALNEGLRRAWFQRDPVSWILARVRCEILRCPPGEYARLMRFSTGHAAQAPETAVRKYFENGAFHRILAGWDEISRSPRWRRFAPILQEARDQLLKHLVGKDEGTVCGELSKWRFRLGAERFHQLSGMDYHSLRLRKLATSLPPFPKILKTAVEGGIVPSELTPLKLLQHPEIAPVAHYWIQEGKKLGRPAIVSNLHVMLACCGHEITPGSLSRTPLLETARVSPRVAGEIFRFKMPEWQQVEPVFNGLAERGIVTRHEFAKIERQWKQRRARLNDSFESRAEKLAHDRGLDNLHLSKVLGIYSEKRKRPETPVFRAFKYGSYERELSPGILAFVVGRNLEEVKQLLDKKRHDIKRDLVSRCSRLDLKLAAERRLWNLSYDDVPVPKNKLQLLEWGRRDVQEERDGVIAVEREIGVARATVAMRNLVKMNSPHTIAGTFQWLVELSGIAPLSDRIGTSPETVRSLAAGEEIPALPLINQFLTRASFALPFDLRYDWQDSFAKHHLVEEQGALNRVLCTMIAMENRVRREYLEARGVDNQEGARQLSMLSASGSMDEVHLSSLLTDLGVDFESPRGKFILAVHRYGDIREALKEWKQGLSKEKDGELIRGLSALCGEAGRNSADRAREIDVLPLNQLIERATEISRILPEDRDPPRHTEAEKRMLAVLDCLPGVTKQDLISLVKIRESYSQRIKVLFGSAIEALRKNDIDEHTLSAMAFKCSPIEKKSRGFIADAIAHSEPSPSLSLGHISLLAAREGENARRVIMRARRLIAAQLEDQGIAPTSLKVEMCLWGVRLADTGIKKKNIQGLLWTERRYRHDEERAVDKVHAIARDRIFESLTAYDARARQTEHFERWGKSQASIIREFFDTQTAGSLKGELENIVRELSHERQLLAASAAPSNGEWNPTQAELRLPTSERFKVLAERLTGGTTVSISKVLTLFPQYEALIRSISASLDAAGRAGQAPWYIASATFFDDPMSALERMAGALEEGRVAKYPGPRHFEHLERHHRSSSRLHGLSPATMGLSFGEYPYES